MLVLQLIAYYFIWHYTIAIKNIILIWSDFVWFFWNYFSIKRLLYTFFVPWKRLGEGVYSYFNIADALSSILVTILMCVFGMVVRFFTILIGFLVIILTILSSFIVLAIWIGLPAILVLLLGVGVNLIVKSF